MRKENIIHCMLCGADSPARFLFYGKDRLHKVDETPFSLYRCENCTLVSLFPQPSQEILQRYYPKDYGPYKDHSQVLSYGIVASFIKNLFGSSLKKVSQHPVDVSNGRVLDFGCGNGAYLEHIKLLHPQWELYGYDTSEFAREQAERKGFHVSTGDLHRDSFPEGYFTLIHLGHVIEHLPDPKETLRLLHHWLAVGGTISLSTPNVGSIAAQLFRSYWFALDTPRHLFLFSPRTITQLLTETGFTIDSITCTRDTGVEIRSINYLFNRSDMRIPFILWHIARTLLFPIGILLAFFRKTSIMSVLARRI